MSSSAAVVMFPFSCSSSSSFSSFVAIRNIHIFAILLLSTFCASFIFAQFTTSAQHSCANGGQFTQRYCLADYNCNAGRPIDQRDPSQGHICIRGWCCTQTVTPKQQVNVRLPQDSVCPVGTFNVELQCRNTQDCINVVIQSGAPRSAIPVLECGGSGYCCTNSVYQKPLRYGDTCLNGGTSLGQQCQWPSDCQRPQPSPGVVGQLGPVCIDNQCCTQMASGGGGTGGSSFDTGSGIGTGTGVDSAQLICPNGGQFTGQYCSGLRVGECNVGTGSLYQRTFTMDAICIQGRCCTNPGGGRDAPQIGSDDLSRGNAVCSQYRLRYIRRHCQSPSNCGFPRLDFSCISGYCCVRESNDGIGIPANGPSGFCPANSRFSRFMGQSCFTEVDCPAAYDTRTLALINVMCIGGRCCGEQDSSTRWRDPSGGGLDTQQPQQPGLIPVRYSRGYCYDGTLTNRQCASKADCSVQESCINNMCCATTHDQERYACGGIQNIGRCETNGYCMRGYCVSASVCCECPYGQPQRDVNNCRNGGCRQGYACNTNGFCCPQCPDGSMPFGSCYAGKCAPGFICRPGNICCEDRTTSTNELEIGGGTRFWQT